MAEFATTGKGNAALATGITGLSIAGLQAIAPGGILRGSLARDHLFRLPALIRTMRFWLRTLFSRVISIPTSPPWKPSSKWRVRESVSRRSRSSRFFTTRLSMERSLCPLRRPQRPSSRASRPLPTSKLPCLRSPFRSFQGTRSILPILLRRPLPLPPQEVTDAGSYR